MDEVFYDEELDRQYDCEHCRDTGKLDGSDFYDCAHCGVAEQHMTLEERMCNLPRSMSIDDMVWAIVRSDRRQAAAVKAAELALLKSKLLQSERELATHKAARIAYASEFPLLLGEPDVGSIHANIRRLKSELAEVRKDAERYRFLSNPNIDVALVLDKQTDWIAPDDSVHGVGGYYVYEYRAGKELDDAIDAASVAQANKEQGNG